MSRTPVVRQISWLAVLPQLAACGAATAIGTWLVRKPNGIGMMLGAATYLAYSIGSRRLIPRDHRRGMHLYRNEQYAAAIQAFEESYVFFSRHRWIDRFRAVVLMSPSAISYREMALCNIAFCYSQLGDGQNAELYYRRAIYEFPNSGLAAAAIRMIESFRNQSPNSTSPE